MTDERERVYLATPEVTPEREDAWHQWKEDYAVACAHRWIADGATDRQEILHAVAAILGDFARLDDMPWMPMGEAFAHRLGAALSGEGELEEPQRTDYINSLRTLETASEYEQSMALAYHFGVSASQAAKLRKDARRQQGRALTSGPTALYRHFDENGDLLYVGIAKEPHKRSEQHAAKSQWFRFVADTQIEWHESREEAEAAERAAIRTEAPVFNRTHNTANRAAAIDYLFGALERPAAAVAKGGAA